MIVKAKLVFYLVKQTMHLQNKNGQGREDSYLTAHPLHSPSMSLKFHSPIGLLSKYVSPIQPVKVVILTASDFWKYNMCWMSSDVFVMGHPEVEK